MKKYLELGPEKNKHSRAARFSDEWHTLGRSDNIKLDQTHDIDTGLPFDAEVFEIVFASHVLEHLVDPVATLKEVFRILAPGGWCRMNLPDARFYINRYLAGKCNIEKTVGALRNYEPGMHRHGFDEDLLLRTFKAAGFTEIRMLKAGESNIEMMRSRYFNTRPDRTIYCEGQRPSSAIKESS